MNEIIKLDSEEDRELIDKILLQRKPLGLYYTIESGKYIGIDNSNGDAWIEEFKTLASCKKWLGG